MSNDSDYFRANAGALIVNQDGKLLAFRRVHIDDQAWQLPQGGLHPNETPLHGVLREVNEETGLTADKLQLLAEVDEWLAYELPEQYRSAKTGRGQVQKWFLFRFLGADSDIRPDQQELSAWQWMDSDALLEATVAFRRPIYRRLVAELRTHSPHP